MTYRVYVVSAGRPGNVPAMRRLLAPDSLTWVVPHTERHEYRQAGADVVIPVKPPDGDDTFQLPRQRNVALDAAVEAGVTCVQSDDDAQRFQKLVDDGKGADCPWSLVRDALIGALDGGTHLAGLPPTDNPFFARGQRLHRGFVLASLHATDVAEPRWDETLPLKEDWDYTCAHLDRFGRVARLDWLLATYRHYSNRGGVVALRTDELESATAERLLQRWPGLLKPHARRAYELALT